MLSRDLRNPLPQAAIPAFSVKLNFGKFRHAESLVPFATGKKLELLPDAAVMQHLAMAREGFEKLCVDGVQRIEQARTRYNVK